MIKTKKGRRAAAYFLILCLCVCQVVNYGAYTAHAEGLYGYTYVTERDISRAESLYGDNYYMVDYYTPRIFTGSESGNKTIYKVNIVLTMTERACVYIGDYDEVILLTDCILGFCFWEDKYYHESTPSGTPGKFIETYQYGKGYNTVFNNSNLSSEDADVAAWSLWTYSTDDEPSGYFPIVNYSDIPVFNSKTAAVKYIKEGTLDKNTCIYNPEVFEYSEDICLDEFKMELHMSKKAEMAFIRFYYKPSDYMLENKGSIKLYTDYTATLTWLNINVGGEFVNSDLGLDFDASEHIFSDFLIELPLSPPNGNYVDLYIVEDFFVPSGFADTLDKISFASVDNMLMGSSQGLSDVLAKVTSSFFDMTIKCSVHDVQGKYYTAYADLLNPNNSYTSFLEPSKDDNGNNTEDYETVAGSVTNIGGYYFTDVSQDNYGNNTYNYYYINEKGLSEEISSDASGNPVTNNDLNIKLDADIDGKFDVNLNVNQGTSSDNSTGGIDIDIADDDYTGGTLVDNIKNLYGLRDDLETAEEDDGALMFLEHLLAALPGDIGGMLGYGCSSVVVVAVLRALLKR